MGIIKGNFGKVVLELLTVLPLRFNYPISNSRSEQCSKLGAIQGKVGINEKIPDIPEAPSQPPPPLDPNGGVRINKLKYPAAPREEMNEGWERLLDFLISVMLLELG